MTKDKRLPSTSGKFTVHLLSAFLLSTLWVGGNVHPFSLEE
jgi:hypothetical protein